MTEPVIDLREIEPGIVLITMQDKVHKNTFSHDFVVGMVQAFEHIRNNSTYKVAILTGYDTYFASGGTQEGLLAIHDGEAEFSDVNIYSLPLMCSIPVIAAMQGHGIGGGFVLGMFADFVVLSRESVYTTNFMRYGFTPGMGGTCVLPEKLGLALAEEMLLNAGNHRGAELEKRGIPFTVLPRAEVLEHALHLARQLSEKPRLSLITLKDHLVGHLREKLPQVIKKELEMHNKTFHQPEVKERIMRLFGR